MPAFHPSAEELPQQFPVFPLEGALLLPGGKLPLNIFEPRYLAMVEESLAAGRMFGMIQPDPSLPEGETGPGLYRIGCLGRISSFSETDDGRYLITLTGIARYTITAEAGMRRGYRQVRADCDAWLNDLRPASPPREGEREALLGALRSYFQRRAFEANWDAVRRIADEQLVTTLAMICPFEPAEKQALLEAPDSAARADVLLALLRMGAAALEPQARAS